MEIQIDRKKYRVLENEFPKHFIQEYCNLEMFKEVGEYERCIGLIRDMIPVFGGEKEIVVVNSTHGGFLPIRLSPYFSKVLLLDQKSPEHMNNITENIKTQGLGNIFLLKTLLVYPHPIGMMVFESSVDLNMNHQVFLEGTRIPVLIMN